MDLSAQKWVSRCNQSQTMTHTFYKTTWQEMHQWLNDESGRNFRRSWEWLTAPLWLFCIADSGCLMEWILWRGAEDYLRVECHTGKYKEKKLPQSLWYRGKMKRISQNTFLPTYFSGTNVSWQLILESKVKWEEDIKLAATEKFVRWQHSEIVNMRWNICYELSVQH